MDGYLLADIAVWVCIIASVVTVLNKICEFTNDDNGQKDNEKGTH